jgi:hypothetical protein
MVVHTYNPSTQKAEAGRSQVGGQSGLWSGFQTSLSYTVRPDLKTEQNKKVASMDKSTEKPISI